MLGVAFLLLRINDVAKLEYLLKKIMLIVGILGVIIIYGGFLYLLFSGRSTAALPWFLLISPWICVYFGLTHVQQVAVIQWFTHKFSFKKSTK
jgi:hypothetical protein